MKELKDETWVGRRQIEKRVHSSMLSICHPFTLLNREVKIGTYGQQCETKECKAQAAIFVIFSLLVMHWAGLPDREFKQYKH